MNLEQDLEQIFPVKVTGEIKVTEGPPVKEIVTTFRTFVVSTSQAQLILGHVPNRKRAVVYSSTEFGIGNSVGEVTNGNGAQFIPQLTAPLEIKGTNEVWAIGTGATATIYVISEVENG